jgi:hypothetical protein
MWKRNALGSPESTRWGDRVAERHRETRADHIAETLALGRLKAGAVGWFHDHPGGRGDG